MTVVMEAAGVAVFSADGRLLLGRHAHDGRWATIGGSVEPGESHDDAAMREARDEVGMLLTSLEPLGRFTGSPIYDVTYPNGDQVRYAVTMFATILEGEAVAQADGNEILQVAWTAQDDLARIDIAPDVAEIIPAAFKWLDSR